MAHAIRMDVRHLARNIWLRRGLKAAALALACAALPGPGGTALAAETGSPCWDPGKAPGLFDWSGSPGTACRDAGAAVEPDPRAPRRSEALVPSPAPRPSGATTQFTFSGSAYMGIAVAY